MMHEHSSRFERTVAVHVVCTAMFAAWSFGGNIGWARTALTVNGLAALALLATGVSRRLRARENLRSLHLLWPLVGLNVLVLLSLFQPALKSVVIEGGIGYVPRSDLSVWPASALPDTSRSDILLFDALFLTAFNVFLAVRHRRTLATMMLLLGGNALALAAFGSVQKLLAAPGLFFSVESPNPQFFGSFIYRNHWGAFAVLMLAACVGLVFCRYLWSRYRDPWHSPAPAAIVGTLALGGAVVLSGARACSLLAFALLTAAVLHSVKRVSAHRRSDGESAAVPVLLLCVALGLAGLGLYAVAQDSVRERLTDTREQLARMGRDNSAGNRTQLYSDTWRMAKDRLLTGWGFGCYGAVFYLYNRQTSPADGLPVYYEHAHSDWLQWLAETGVIGTALFVALIVAPLLLAGRIRPLSSFPRYLLAGCSLILLYACIEFPLANPAVLLSFWLCYFAALRWAQLEAPESRH